MQAKEEHLFQVFVNRVKEASQCEDRELVESWISLDPDWALVPQFSGMTQEQVQDVDISEVVREINEMWDEVS
jgi:hypothetical protein